MLNYALCKGGSCWSRSRRRCVPLAAIREPILHCAVPADPVDVGRGLLELYGRVRVQFPPFVPLDAATFKPIASWRSSAARRFVLESSFYAKAVDDRSVSLKILRSLNPMPQLPSPARSAPACKFCVKMPLSANLFPAATFNALLSALPIAASELLSFIVERGVVRSLFAEDAARVQRERLCSGAIDTFTSVVDLSR